MKHCDQCHVDVKSHRKYCPLCHQLLTGEVEDFIPEVYPKFFPLRRPLLPFTKKVLRVTTIVAIFLLMIINAINFDGKLWSIIPIGAILYFWVLVRYGLLTNQNVPFRIAFLTTILIVLLVIYDTNTIDYSQNTTSVSWALNYVTPLGLLVASVAISFIIWLKRINYRDYLFYLVTILVFSFVPLVLFFLDVIQVAWPSITTFSVAILILAIIVFFFPKHIKDEIKKRFHL
ncbi:MAG: DUF6320 domain-containing protein [Candidatus Izemoplasmatales bacterium]|nr:DUF6320 domain-containing protein [bacterium]MDZ4196028.1 DUF6320 domain-containing protein [Candidatus Izemoplasmatales bacterium]